MDLYITSTRNITDPVALNTVKAYLALSDKQVRIRVEADNEMCDFGDTFSNDVNGDGTEETAERLKEEERKEIARANRDGVWGYIAEYFDGKTWNEAWSCWGFVGNDFEGSGYDIDALNMLIDAVLAMRDAEHYLGFEERVGECACN